MRLDQFIRRELLAWPRPNYPTLPASDDEVARLQGECDWLYTRAAMIGGGKWMEQERRRIAIVRALELAVIVGVYAALIVAAAVYR